MESADPEKTAEQAAAAWDAALAGIEAHLEATGVWLDGHGWLDGNDAGPAQPGAAAPLWARPEGLPAVPDGHVDRLLRLLERQQDLVRRVTDARQAAGSQLEAVRQVLATKAPAPGIYLDRKG